MKSECDSSAGECCFEIKALDDDAVSLSCTPHTHTMQRVLGSLARSIAADEHRHSGVSHYLHPQLASWALDWSGGPIHDPSQLKSVSLDGAVLAYQTLAR